MQKDWEFAKSRYSNTSRTAMTPPSLLRDDPWAESHDLRCFGKLGSKTEGGYPLWTVGSVIGGDIQNHVI